MKITKKVKLWSAVIGGVVIVLTSIIILNKPRLDPKEQVLSSKIWEDIKVAYKEPQNDNELLDMHYLTEYDVGEFWELNNYYYKNRNIITKNFNEFTKKTFGVDDFKLMRLQIGDQRGQKADRADTELWFKSKKLNMWTYQLLNPQTKTLKFDNNKKEKEHAIMLLMHNFALNKIYGELPTKEVKQTLPKFKVKTFDMDHELWQPLESENDYSSDGYQSEYGRPVPVSNVFSIWASQLLDVSEPKVYKTLYNMIMKKQRVDINYLENLFLEQNWGEDKKHPESKWWNFKKNRSKLDKMTSVAQIYINIKAPLEDNVSQRQRMFNFEKWSTEGEWKKNIPKDIRDAQVYLLELMKKTKYAKYLKRTEANNYMGACQTIFNIFTGDGHFADFYTDLAATDKYNLEEQRNWDYKPKK